MDWVAIYRAKTITWQFPELPDPNGVIERELIADGTVTAEQLRTFEDSSQAWQDEIWTAAAEEILEKHRPNLLLFHLLTLDDTNHEYGPMSPASFTAMAFLDAKVKQILDVAAADRAFTRRYADRCFGPWFPKYQAQGSSQRASQKAWPVERRAGPVERRCVGTFRGRHGRRVRN